MKRRFFLSAAAIITFTVSTAFILQDSPFFLRVNKGIDLFGRLYREVTLNYVDEIDPSAFVEAGIEGMLATLDPYTVYLSQDEEEEVDLLTTGIYGGVGVTITIRDGSVIVTAVMEKLSAARAGVRVGDRITHVNGETVMEKTLRDILGMVRGQTGTELTLTIDREGEERALDFTMMREEIRMRSVNLFAFVEPGIAYIHLERFSRNAGEDLRLALRELRATDSIKGLVLDLRDNPGGLLDIAVDVAGRILPESSLVVTTRGRRPSSRQEYVTRGIPSAPAQIPLAILINRQSASASEIVAGAVQDLDRGVVVGERSFGKGLVQTVTRIGDQGSLKMTTGRYYTPSGRSIQEVEYLQRDQKGIFIKTPDSLRIEYRTAHKRRVLASGGIDPDTLVRQRELSPYVKELYRTAMFFRFANQMAQKTDTILPGFRVSDSLLNAFQSFLREKNFAYTDPAEQKLSELRSSLRTGIFSDQTIKHTDALEAAIQAEKSTAFDRQREEIRQELRLEIVGRINGDRARRIAAFPLDRQLQTAIMMIKKEDSYKRILE